MSALFCLRGLEMAVPPASSIVASCEGHHLLTLMVLQHREHINTSYSRKFSTKIVSVFYILIRIVNHIFKI